MGIRRRTCMKICTQRVIYCRSAQTAAIETRWREDQCTTCAGRQRRRVVIEAGRKRGRRAAFTERFTETWRLDIRPEVDRGKVVVRE